MFVCARVDRLARMCADRRCHDDDVSGFFENVRARAYICGMHIFAYERASRVDIKMHRSRAVQNSMEQHEQHEDELPYRFAVNAHLK